MEDHILRVHSLYPRNRRMKERLQIGLHLQRKMKNISNPSCFSPALNMSIQYK